MFVLLWRPYGILGPSRPGLSIFYGTWVTIFPRKGSVPHSAIHWIENSWFPQSTYTIILPMQIRSIMLRRGGLVDDVHHIEIPLRVFFSLLYRMFIIQAINIGTVFVNLPEATSAYFSLGGVFLWHSCWDKPSDNAVFVPALFNMSEMPALFAQRSIAHRHTRAVGMYHPMVEAIAMTIVDLPTTFMIISLYTIILYFIVHLQRTAGQSIPYIWRFCSGAVTIHWIPNSKT